MVYHSDEILLDIGIMLPVHCVYSHPGSGSDRTIASVRQVTALVMLYIGRLVTCGIDYSFTP